MAKSDQTLYETETTILWNELDAEMTLWTASPAVRREWVSFGFPVESHGSGWRCKCPKDRLAYRTYGPRKA